MDKALVIGKSVYNVIKGVFIGIKLVVMDIWDFAVTPCSKCKKECPVDRNSYHGDTSYVKDTKES
jgi:hypothetical protein